MAILELSVLVTPEWKVLATFILVLILTKSYAVYNSVIFHFGQRGGLELNSRNNPETGGHILRDNRGLHHDGVADPDDTRIRPVVTHSTGNFIRKLRLLRHKASFCNYGSLS
mmetsp:Transcript_51308/g.69875  ORF Transcript_51308/g.69875 Transcript_51308/m.69875 type:complete len:112 (-) Transcript_51308:290-625(-)